MKFELNETEQKSAKQFIDMCHLIESYKGSILDDKRPLHFEYIFSNTNGIGQCSAIQCEELNIGINLTDYSAW